MNYPTIGGTVLTNVHLPASDFGIGGHVTPKPPFGIGGHVTPKPPGELAFVGQRAESVAKAAAEVVSLVHQFASQLIGRVPMGPNATPPGPATSEPHGWASLTRSNLSAALVDLGQAADVLRGLQAEL